MSGGDELAVSAGVLGQEPTKASSEAADPATGATALGLLAAASWLIAGGLTLAWPDNVQNAYTQLFGVGLGVIGVAVLAGALGLPGHRRAAPWLLALGGFLGLWEVLSAKAALLPQPFFPPPQALIEVYADDWQRLGLSTLYSLRLLVTGYLIGSVVGFVIGIAIGWSKVASYWVHPILRFIGPLPAVAWLPIAFFAFPSSWSASIFLIALATGFPVAILTWSGVAAVPAAYYDVARTLGADERFLVLKVAIPAAMPPSSSVSSWGSARPSPSSS